MSVHLSGCPSGRSFRRSSRVSSRSVSVLAALAVALLAACGSGGSGGSGAADPAVSGVASAAASGTAALEVTLTHERIASALGLGVAANVTGLVPQLITGDGQPVAAADTEVMGTHITWGDGAEDGSDPGDVTCSTGGTLVPLDEQYTYSHTYAKAGTYTVTFTAGACAPLKDVTKTVDVTVG